MWVHVFVYSCHGHNTPSPLGIDVSLKACQDMKEQEQLYRAKPGREGMPIHTPPSLDRGHYTHTQTVINEIKKDVLRG